MASKKTKSQLQAELAAINRSRRSAGVVDVLTSLIRWSGLVAIAYFGASGVSALAGTSTDAKIGVNFLADVRVSSVVSWLVASGGVGYGLRQRQLRRQTVERLGNRVPKLERSIDERRSSSGLSPTGSTPSERDP
jgi:hypothetical protein